MPLNIYKANDKFIVSVSPPDGPLWRSSSPMTTREVMRKLKDLGCHQTDVMDALYRADPDWGKKLAEREGTA